MVERDIKIVRKIENVNLDDKLVLSFQTSEMQSDSEGKHYRIELFAPANNWQFIAVMPRLVQLFSTILNHKYPESYIDVERDFFDKSERIEILKGPSYTFYKLDEHLYQHLKQFFEQYKSNDLIIHESTYCRSRRDDAETTIVRRYNYQSINIKQLYIDLYTTYIDEISKIEKFDDLII